jgi:hypothetical protein
MITSIEYFVADSLVSLSVLPQGSLFLHPNNKFNSFCLELQFHWVSLSHSQLDQHQDGVWHSIVFSLFSFSCFEGCPGSQLGPCF